MRGAPTTLKSFRAYIHARTVDQIVLSEPVAAFESPRIDFLETRAADDSAQVLAVFKSIRRDDPELIRQHDLFDPAADKGIAPQRLQLLRQLQTAEIQASVKEKFAQIRDGVRNPDGTDLCVAAKNLIAEDGEDLVVRDDDIRLISLIAFEAESAVFYASVVEFLHVYTLPQIDEKIVTCIYEDVNRWYYEILYD
jgi:hypothetical protein